MCTENTCTTNVPLVPWYQWYVLRGYVVGTTIGTVEYVYHGTFVRRTYTRGSQCTCVPFSNQKVVTSHYKYVRTIGT
jgi:hypothetical protein